MGKPLFDVLAGKTPERRPVWLMRQAGRYLPEYRAVREKAGSFLKLCYNPELAAEVTLQPLQRFDFDAAIVFADILVVPHAMGLSLDFVEGEGPLVGTVSDSAGVAALSLARDAPQFLSVFETLRRTKQGLNHRQTLIGFCGAPWTVASYMVEGGSSDRQKALAAAIRGEPWFEVLIEKLVQVSIGYLVGQVRAGAEVLQIFDSWAGDLPLDLRERWVLQPIARLVDGVRAQCPGVPLIVFARGVGSGHVEVAQHIRPEAISVEQDVDLGNLVTLLPAGVAVQGNLSPQVLLGSEAEIVAEVKRIVRSIPINRHVFNLGHGIVPQTPPDHVTLLLNTIRAADGGAW